MGVVDMAEKGKRFIKNDMLGDENAIGLEFKTPIALVFRGIPKETT